MRVLLMNVPDAHVGKTTDDWDLEASDIGAFPPMGILYLAGAVRAAGRHEVRVLDCIVDKLSPDMIASRVTEFDPDVVGFTVYTPNLFDALVVSRKVRQALPRVKLVWGGPHTMLFPDESMAQPEVDFLVTGEAEETFPAFLDALESGTGFDHIPGIWHRDGVAVKHTGPPAYVQDINALPFPAFDMLDFRRYYSAIGTGLPVGTVVDTRATEGGLFTTARIRLAVNLNRIEEVWVLQP